VKVENSNMNATHSHRKQICKRQSSHKLIKIRGPWEINRFRRKIETVIKRLTQEPSISQLKHETEDLKIYGNTL